jgi:uncharacterized protein (DUF2237 family)
MRAIQVRPRNVLGGELQSCCIAPVTGFYRDGFCRVDLQDYGVHAVCAVMTDEFLEFSRAMGNDLSTPRPEFGFPGLKAGDKWCLCANRWAEAYQAGAAPHVLLESTHEAALEVVPMSALTRYAVQAG